MIAGGLRSEPSSSTDVQKLIAKYGLAAHLAILAVAPLFLFPFCATGTVAWVLVWLVLPVALWTVLEPSLRGGEYLHDARRRVVKAVFRDPLFWASLVLVVFTGFRALNSGISLSYNAEASVWLISSPTFPILPGVVGSAGDLSFAVALACAVLLQACRHSLGRSARMAFLLLASFLSGLAAIIALVALHGGAADALALLPSDGGAARSFVALAFGLHLIGGLVALIAIAEYRWRFSFFLLLSAIGGNAAGLFAFAPAYLSAAFVAAGILALAYVLVFSFLVFSSSDGFNLMVTGGIALVLGGLLAAAILPKAVMDERLAAFTGFALFPERFWEIRGMLSAVAFKSWISHIWIGTGIDSFPLDFRFAAQDADWALLPRGATAVANGWWLLLAERGLVGTVFFVLPFGFLLFTYVRRLAGGVRTRALPHPACLIAPVAMALFVATGFVDCSSLRAEVLMAMCAYLAVSAAAFPRMRGNRNG